MEIRMTCDTTPSNLPKPIETYETHFLSLGFGRYDVVKKVMSRIEVKEDGKVLYTETPMNMPKTFPKVYHSEYVRVTIYSQSPKLWKEELSPYDYTFFQQVTHVA